MRSKWVNRSAYLAACVSGMMLAACNDLSVKEAQDVALGYQASLFTPAPRELDEIYGLIAKYDNKKPVHPCRLCDREINEKKLSRQIHLTAKKGIGLHRQGKTEEGLKYANEAMKLYRTKPDSVYIDRATEALLFNVLSQIHAQSGNYHLAIRYASHIASALDADDRGRKGKRIFIKTFLAEQYAALGDIDQAEYALRDAVESYEFLIGKKPEHHYRPVWESKVRLATAQLAQAKGQLREAEKKYREAIPWLKKDVQTKKMLQRDGEVTTRGVWLVKNLIDQGRIAEADSEARAAVKRSLLVFGRNAPTTAKAIMGLSQVMMVRGRYDDVEKLMEITRDILLRTGGQKSSPYYIEATSLLAEASLAQFNSDKALSYYNAIIQSVQHEKSTLNRYINGNLGYAIALLRANDLEQAKKIATEVSSRRRAFLGDDHPQVLEADVVLNLIRIKQKADIKTISQAVELIPAFAESVHERLVQQKEPGMLQVRLVMLLEGYMQRLSTMNNAGRYDNELFAMSQMVQSQKVQRALASSAARVSVEDAKLAELIRTEQDLSYKIKSAYDSLSRFKIGQDEKANKAKAELQQKIGELESARKSIRDEVADQFPDYDQLVRPKPATVSQVQQVLKNDEAMVSYYFAENQGYVFAIPKTGKMQVKTLRASRQWIEKKVATLRKALDSGAQSLSAVPDYNVNASYELYSMILEPVRTAWATAKSLAVVPNGALASMPVTALATQKARLIKDNRLRFSEYRNVKWLANTHAVSYLPSVMSLKALRGVKAANVNRKPFAGFGNPIFSAAVKPVQAGQSEIRVRGLRKVKSGQLDTVRKSSVKLGDLVQLPETEFEISEVAKALKVKAEQNVFVGMQASEQTLKSMKLDDRKIVMFATHALVPGDLDGLEQPAIALSSPDVTKAKDDGLLTMAEVLGLKLDADWVVLSACNTGAASGKGADAISGLGMAFFYAGSRSLLVTHWPVETHSALSLTTGLFKLQAVNPSVSRAEAMASTVRDIIRQGVYKANGKNVYSFAHPMFWAPFALVGDGAS